MTDFQPTKGKYRKRGTGSISQPGVNSWVGQFSVIWPDGIKKTRYVSARTKDECEEKLAALITEMKADLAAEQERLKEETKTS